MDDNRFAMFMGLIGSVAKSIQRIKAARMEPYNLSAAHTDCLCSLAGAMPEGLTQTQLAQRLCMDRAQISRVLRDLRERAYVCADAAAYKSRYRLTEAGARLAEEASRVIREVNGFVSGDIPREDIDRFYSTFRIIAQNLADAVALYGAPTLPDSNEERRP